MAKEPLPDSERERRARWETRIEQKLIQDDEAHTRIENEVRRTNDVLEHHTTEEDSRWDRVVEHMTRNEALHEKVIKLDETIHGNGKDGLKVDVDRHEQRLKRIDRLSWAVVGTVLVLAAKAVANFFGFPTG